MNPEKFALLVGIAVFVGGSLGLVLHRIVPEKHLTGGLKDMWVRRIERRFLAQ